MNSQFSNYTTTELQKKAKKQKTTMLIHGFVIFLMIILAIISTIHKGISVITFLPLFFVPMQIVMFMEFKKLNKEISNRGKI